MNVKSFLILEQRVVSWRVAGKSTNLFQDLTQERAGWKPALRGDVVFFFPENNIDFPVQVRLAANVL
jgi:hypothetical protein